MRRIILWTTAVAWLAAVSAPVFSQDWIIRFRPGDTFWDLCIKYSNKRGCWIELGKYNDIANDRTVPPGREIRFPSAWLTTMPAVGRVETVMGEVLYHEKSRGPGRPLVAGQTLLLGSRIVARQGSAQITLGDDSALLIRPGGELSLDNLSSDSRAGQSAELSLSTGEVEVEVKPDAETRFEVRTPAAVAAVRGTHYRVSSLTAGSAATRSEVLDGAVEVSGVGTTLVPAGFGLLSRQGQAPDPPRKLLPPPVFDQSRVDAPEPVQITWRSDPAAVSWRLDLLLGHKGEKLAASYAPTVPEMVLTGLGEGCYTLVLWGIDAAGFNGLPSRLPVCVVPRLPAPTSVSITRTKSAGARYRIEWSAVAGASQYRLELAADPEFSEIISSRLVTQTATDVALSEADQFSVRVIALDDHANPGAASHIEQYVKPNYVVPALMTAIFLLLLLV